MIEVIKREKTVDAFLLVFNGNDKRWDSSTKNVLKLLEQNFPDFYDNTIVVLNQMPMNEDNIKRRKKVRSDMLTAAAVKEFIREISQTPSAILPVVCLDTKFDEQSLEEVQAFKLSIEFIFSQVKLFRPYNTSKAEAHRTKIEEAEEEERKL